MSYLILSMFLLAVFIYAMMEARADHWDIEHDVHIDHKRGLIARMILCGFLLCVCWLGPSIFDPFTLKQVLWIPMGWALWTMAFRYRLNRKRGLDWRYVSPSNWYDWQFLKRLWFTSDGYITTQTHAVIYHRKVYPSGPFYLRAVRVAGTFAYAFECLVFLASAAGLWWWA